MSQETEDRSVLIRFIDSFFEERNIKWMLGIGMMILFGSSVMLVTSHWETYAPVWKHAILLAYTAAIFGTAGICHEWLSLRRTGTVLKALTVLLMPMNFLAMHRIWGTSGGGLLTFGMESVLFGLTCGLSGFASLRIFRDFLRGHQPSFVCSYLILCVAGAIVPNLSVTWSPFWMFCLWAVFTVGAVKVNRHVFWLAEQHRLPRIFGFFPIGLLGTQFLTLVWSTKLVYQVPLEWMGLAAVLVSLPVLLTADAVARVFQERTGNIVRPIPWSIMLPLLTGLLLCLGGVSLSLAGFPKPYALVPTAALAAAMLAVIANRTEKTAFVWGMLACVLLAYNFSPLYFLTFARAVVHQGAAVVHEQKLPFAFYGLTYLPLLTLATIASHLLAKRKDQLFSPPLKLFVAGLEIILLVAALTHAKAVFLVSISLLPLLALQAWLFRNRRFLDLGVLSFIAAAYGVNGFLRDIVGLSVLSDLPFVSMALAAVCLLFPGKRIDCWAASLERPHFPEETTSAASIESTETCQLASLILTMVTSCVWGIQYGILGSAIPLTSGLVLSGLLFVQALKWLKPGIGEAVLCFAGLNVYLQLASRSYSLMAIGSILTVLLLFFWLASYVLQWKPRSRFTLAFGEPLQNVSLVGLTLILLGNLALMGQRSIESSIDIPWISVALTLVWAFDAARRCARSTLAWLGCIGILIAEAAVLSTVYGPQRMEQLLPVAWAITALIAVLISASLQRRIRLKGCNSVHGEKTELEAIERPVSYTAFAVLSFIAVISLVAFTSPWRTAGAIAAVGLLVSARLHQSSYLKTIGLVLLNWQAICAVAQLFVPQARSIFELNGQNLSDVGLPVAWSAALSLFVIEIFKCVRKTPESDPAEASDEHGEQNREIQLIHRILLRFATAATLFGALPWGNTVTSSIGVATVISTFVMLILCEFLAACRLEREERVWSGEVLAGIGVAYLVAIKSITLGSSVSMFVVLGVSFAAWGSGRIAGRFARTKVLQNPLMNTGMALPLLVVGLSGHRHLTVSSPEWLGMNSLALLLTAGFYFWLGIERSQKWLVVLAAGILNIALSLLWRELAWHDPQFFMIPLGISALAVVQLLKREIPAGLHTPLTYLGALTILVSPTFHIVGGSWWHLLSLMILSVAVALVAIGLRVRALMYTGTAFLLADLVAMVCRGGIDYPNLLWAGGIAIGASVLVLAAICERYRETLLQRLRLLAAELETWE